MSEAKQRKIRKADWDKVEKYVKSVYDERRESTFRKEHEGKWKEVDRQVEMIPLRRVNSRGAEIKSWHNALELGELSKASEIITSDVMRIAFPTDKSWFQPHVMVNWETNPQTGRPNVIPEQQKISDGLMRSLMGQQHADFGLKTRIRLSIKECLHHGSFVAEVVFEKKLMAKSGGRIKTVGSPVWRPYSMWNAYPDPSPSISGTDMFYDGSMVLVDYKSLAKLKNMAKGEGWMQDRLAKVEEEEHKTKAGKTKDVELVKFYGDIVIDRADGGDVFLPNSRVILANGKIVFWAENELPYPNIIHGGYERQDVRDPYYTSPIIKQSPTQKAGSITFNKFLDALSLEVEPPLEYDGNDPDYVANDGPTIAPGAKTPTKSMGKGMQVLKIGASGPALEGLQVFLRQMQEGTGVSALRSGTTNSDRQTAFEVNKVAQGAEVRTVEFVSQLEPNFRTFLYMQHELNRLYMEDYEFMNDEMHTPDVMTVKKASIQGNCHFDVVGTRGLLGEEQRTQRTTQVTAFASDNPLFAPLLKPAQVLLDMYRDAGKKNPEEWVKAEGGPTPQDAMMQQKMQELQQMLQQCIEENKALKSKHDEKMAELQLDARKHAEEIKNERQQFAVQMAEQKREFDKEWALKVAELKNAVLTDSTERLLNVQAGGELGKVVKEIRGLVDQHTDGLQKASETIQQVADNVTSIQQASQKKNRKKITAPSGKQYMVEDLPS